MMAERVLVVIVLYVPADDAPAPVSRTLRCIQEAFAAQPAFLERYHLLLWDNSPKADKPLLSTPCEYHHAAENDGVSGAYNGALQVGIQHGYEWMLLLDDDTEVSAEYLAGMLECRDTCADDGRVAAIAPLLLEGEVQLSPQRVLRHRAVPVVRRGPRVVEEECFAANSGILLRVASLAAIGGYSLDFWLDYSDIYVFHRLYQAGLRLYFASHLQLQHSMTMLDYDGRMTVERYRNFLHAEQAFFDLYRGSSQRGVQVLRLAARVFRQRAYRNKAFSRLTLQFLLRRVTTPRAKRLQHWQERKTARHSARPVHGA